MHIPTPTLHVLHCEEPWFSYLRKGIKPVEGRKNTFKYQTINVGDLIKFTYQNEHFLVRVTEIRSYASLEEYLTDVTIEKALPGIVSLAEAINTYLQWSTPEEIKSHGFLGIFVTISI